MTINPKQVQLRGGTSSEHVDFAGASREITVDTTLNTLRVHDGYTKGGHIICKKNELDQVNYDLNKRIDDIKDNIGNSHNHDNLYLKKSGGTGSNLTIDDTFITGRDIRINGKRALVGKGTNDGDELIVNYDSDYKNGVRFYGNVNMSNLYVQGNTPITTVHKNSHGGFCLVNGNDTAWIRSTANGILPYQSGGYSSIGASGWAFNEGHFNALNAHTLNMKKNGYYSKINFSAQTNDPGYIEHYENNNSSHLRFSVSDDNSSSDEIQFGVHPSGSYRTNVSFRGDGTSWFRGNVDVAGSYLSISGKRIYIQSSQPSGARTGDIWFQI